ncbi:RNA polymerase sigma factor [Streptosporangium lutulentum]
MSAKSLQGDAELLAATREADAEAYYWLYRRHVSAAWALAQQLVSGEAEVEDVVEKTFAGIHHVIERGGGPEQAFRVYLLTALRHTIHDRSERGDGQEPGEEIEPLDPEVPFVDPALAHLRQSPPARAFLSLPERWRLVLWHVEVESGRLADIAVLLNLTENGVAALAYQAREKMRQACLRIHLAETLSPECRPMLGKLGNHVRGGLTKREPGRGRAHERLPRLPRRVRRAGRYGPEPAGRRRSAHRRSGVRRVSNGAGQDGRHGRRRGVRPVAAGAPAPAARDRGRCGGYGGRDGVGARAGVGGRTAALLRRGAGRDPGAPPPCPVAVPEPGGGGAEKPRNRGAATRTRGEPP